jgi:HSP20 family protein
MFHRATKRMLPVRARAPLPSWRTMETAIADVPVEVKKVAPAQANVPDVWHSFRGEMDRLFDRFSSGFGFPSLRRMFDVEPSWRSASSFSFAAPAIDMSEEEKAYKISAELDNEETE